MMVELGRALIGILLATALAVTTPMLGWCAPAQHRDQLVHPLFEHAHHELAHGPSHAAGAPTTFKSATVAAATAAQTLSWATGADAMPPVVLGIPAPPLAGAISLEVAQPAEHLADPAFPPPR